MNIRALWLVLPAVLLNTACPNLECSTDGQTACGTGDALVCADLQSDRDHCGACGVVCEFGNQCSEGACVPCEGGDCGYDVVAACSTNGDLVGLELETDRMSAPVAVGPNAPLAVVPFRETLLVPDFDGVLLQVRQGDLAEVGARATIGQDARFVTTEDPFVYVVNSITGTLQIFEAAAGDAGAALTLRSELPLAETEQGNTFAQGVVKVGSTLYIPLQGGFGEAQAAIGQRVLKVDVTNPAQPQRTGAISLTGLDLQPFEGMTALPRPSQIVSHGGALYVALNNSDAFYSVAGPGMLAKISLPGEQVTVVPLGADRCLSASYLAIEGSRLYVSCGGRAQFDQSTYELLASEKAGVVVVETDAVVGAWTAACPEGSTGCGVPLPGRLTAAGDEVYVGDQNAGRVFVLAVAANGALSERRGPNVAAGPIVACPVDESSGFSNVIDVVAIP